MRIKLSRELVYETDTANGLLNSSREGLSLLVVRVHQVSQPIIVIVSLETFPGQGRRESGNMSEL